MYMGMEVEFDFEVPPVEEFSKRICKQVESNIDKSNREERVQRKKRELRERIKMQIVSSPYTSSTPRQSVVDCNRRDSMTLPLERRSFTPFQKVPFKNQNVAESRPRHSYLDAESLRSKSEVVTTATTNEPQDIDLRLSLLSTSTSKVESQTYTSSKESLSSNSTFSAMCSPPQRTISPTLGAHKSTKSMFDKDDAEDDRSVPSTLQSLKSNTFVTATEKGLNQIESDTEKTREKIAKEDFWNSIPVGSEYIEAEFYWVVDYRGTDKTFDSDAFTFAGTRFRLTFSPNNLTPPEKSSGYSLLLALAQSHGRAYVACEFSVHGLLRPTFRRKCSRNLHFTPRSSVYRGYKHFMGPELLSYLENGTFTFSILMKTYIGPKGELLGLSDPLGGVIRNPKNVDTNNNTVDNINEKNKEKDNGDDNDDNNSEIASYSCEGEGEEECRMDEIYPKPRENNYFYRSSSNLRQNMTINPNLNLNMNRSQNMSVQRNSGIIGTGSGINRNCGPGSGSRSGPGSGPRSGHGVGRGRGRCGNNCNGRIQSSVLSHSYSYHNCINQDENICNNDNNKNKEKFHNTNINTNINSNTNTSSHTNSHHKSNSSSVASTSTSISTSLLGLPSPSGDVRGTTRRRYFSDTVNSISIDGRNT